MSSIHRKRLLCKDTMKCSTIGLGVYPYLKPLSKNEIYDNLDFRQNTILDEIKNILRDSEMKDRSSVFLINLGIHYTMGINFTTYQKLIDEMTVILRNRKELGSNAKIVWKTSTVIRKEMENNRGNMMPWRFISEPVSNWLLLNHRTESFIFDCEYKIWSPVKRYRISTVEATSNFAMSRCILHLKL